MSWLSRKPSFKATKGVLIYFLGFYVLIQFVWWAFMLVELNAEIYNLKLEMLSVSDLVGPEQLIQKAELDQKLTLRIWMVLGEGAVFVFLLLLGFWAIHRSIAKELNVAEQQKNFLLSITHELKSPLAAIKLQLQTLNTRELPEEKKLQLYKRALADTDRLENLVENLLLVNKVESGGLPLNKETVNFSELLTNQVRTTYSKELEDGRLKTTIQDGIRAEIDKMAIQSIVINLIDNAIKYGGGSEVTVELSVKDTDSVECSVSDRGEGIPNSEKKKVFERFYRRGSEDVRQTKGTGIGLYLVKLLVEKHDGTITIQDNKPTGARFVVQFPAAT
ncbi:MAG: HAMP domain-containing histidine kinase [Flavobacteriales bacterium]|nr:HAMP domain-containing histidine kinase [Flavobacteriales bacterium]